MEAVDAIVVLNPISGTADKSDLRTAVHDFAAENNLHIHWVETTGDAVQDQQNIQQAYLNHTPQRVIAIGGDGTIKLVGEALATHQVTIGILPAGSANGLAADFGLPADVDQQLIWAFQGEPQAVDMIEIENHKCIHLSDFGLNAELIRNFEKSGVRGVWGYALQSFTTLKEQGDPFQVTIEHDGTTTALEAQMVIIANSKCYGTGVVINPHGEMNDGIFEIVVLTKTDWITLGKIVLGNIPEETGEVLILSCKRATVTTSRPIAFQVDGEYLGYKSRINAEIRPQCMRIALAPAVTN